MIGKFILHVHLKPGFNINIMCVCYTYLNIVYSPYSTIITYDKKYFNIIILIYRMY